MPPRKTTPTTFDGWLGKIIDDETSTHGGRPAVAAWIGVSEQSVNRRARGEVPYLAREVEIIGERAGFEVGEVVERALKKYGGMPKLLAEYDPSLSEGEGNVTAHDNVSYMGRVKPPLAAAADENPRAGETD